MTATGLMPTRKRVWGDVIPYYLGTYQDTVDRATYDFAVTGLQAYPQIGRFHLVGVGTSDDPSMVLTVTALAAGAGGADVVGTLLVQNGNGANAKAALFRLPGIVVNSCTIRVGCAVTTTRLGIDVFALDNAALGYVAVNSAVVNSGAASIPVNTEARGAVFGFSYTSTDTSSTWTGLTEVQDNPIESGRSFTGAMLATPAASSPLAISVTNGVRAAVAASFRRRT